MMLSKALQIALLSKCIAIVAALDEAMLLALRIEHRWCRIAKRTDGPIITVPNVGKIEGVDLDPCYPTLAEFRGIPYAKPPVDSLRWQPPEAYPGWGDGKTFKATVFGNSCMQAPFPYLSPGVQTHEDCLFLNIATPKIALENGVKLPVMIYIHGGGYRMGSGDEIDLSRAPLVSSSKDSIVVVTLNYRLGVFGFLGSSEMKERTNGNGAGNFGTQDQRLAMTWIKKNIGAFGGDSDSITIFGQSAGGASVIQHLTQPASYSLYHKCIIQSGGYNLNSKRMADAENFYAALLIASGCTSLECLVATSADDLLNYTATATEQIRNETKSLREINYDDFHPVIDGVSLINTPSALIAAKQYNREVPVMIGSVRDDLFDPLVPENLTEAEFEAWGLQSLGPTELEGLRRVYDPKVYTYPANLGNASMWYWMYRRYLNDRIIGHGACSVRWLARLLDEAGTPSVYSFLFNHSDALSVPVFAVNHGDDVRYCLDELDEVYSKAGLHPSDIPGEAKKLAQTMAAYWVSFAKTGDPNPTGDTADGTAVIWPKFTTEGDTILSLGVESAGGMQAQAGVRKRACDWQIDQALLKKVLVKPDGQIGPFAEGADSQQHRVSSEAATWI